MRDEVRAGELPVEDGVCVKAAVDVQRADLRQLRVEVDHALARAGTAIDVCLRRRQRVGERDRADLLRRPGVARRGIVLVDHAQALGVDDARDVDARIRQAADERVHPADELRAERRDRRHRRLALATRVVSPSMIVT